ncbi:hypothetical protein [Methylobrevis pamukkalensis]|uniref:Gamma-glutamylcyclotransferase AIG2-like domain-containing protein n=1 Tax=Methylobrevis pamukkalensis TaxID=1439726 RepID=A0A1E3H376_9HYPH|nr:hypothetical protein [Methylobrevis pamukkalensis]ODN70585.1 hypothetical protein A6302_02073 [Methylobrevis pamukkalensis]
MTGLVGYIGYGSLVNRATLRTDFVDLVPCRLRGWRRGWRHRILRTSGHTQTVLTAVPDAVAEIDAVIVVDRLENLPLVDARERGYDRLPVAADKVTVGGPIPSGLDLHVYVSKAPWTGPPADSHPIPLSYVDAVAGGYRAVFGEEGLAGFFTSTIGWDVPMLDDRATPTYPRAVARDPALEAMVDAAIAARRLS